MSDCFIDSTLELYVGGGVLPTILLNGKIIGIWNRNIVEGSGPIKLSFFSHFEKRIEKEIIEKVKAIGRLMADRELVHEIHQPPNLF